MNNLFSEDSAFMTFLNRFSDMVILNILFLITCLPVFTIGAALTALNYTAMHAVAYEDGYISKKYFKAFKDNFKQSTIAWLILLVVGGVLFFDVYFWVNYWKSDRVDYAQIMIVVSVIMAFVYLMGLVWIFPIMAKFNNTIKGHIWNALALAIKHFPWTLLMCIVVAGVAFFSWNNFYVLVFMVIIGFGMISYLYALMFNHLFKKYITAEEERQQAEAEAEASAEDNENEEVTEDEDSQGETDTDNVEDSLNNADEDHQSELTDADSEAGRDEAGTIKKKGRMVQYVNAFTGDEDEDEA